MPSRRDFLKKFAFTTAGALAMTKTLKAQHQEHPVERKPNQPEAQFKPEGYLPVETPDLKKMPWTMENGVKVFHISADVVKTEFIPGKEVFAWGYNGSVPGPTIEVVEGDHCRFIFHNNLPEPTTIHWHGLEIPIEMDGMPGISQPVVQPGGTFTYEFTLHQKGTFFY
ncbi:multicopper oxidase domain-containing protein, partial [bacterium]|nr:multicopper oxidase domain-containing protein [bacterium]